MPLCGCFHSYELVRLSARRYSLTFPPGGVANIQHILMISGVATSVDADFIPVTSFRPSRTFNLTGVANEDQLRRILDTLKDKIIVDLSPGFDQCYSLGPYSVFSGDGGRSYSRWGQLVNRAKYQRDEGSSIELAGALNGFIGQNPTFQKVNGIVSAPKGDKNTPDLAGYWAKEIAFLRGWQQFDAERTKATDRPQKVRSDTESEEDLVNRVAGTIRVRGVTRRSNILVLDDIIGSGGTIREIGRALRESGASYVVGLSVAKDAKDTRGGVDLKKELWE